MNNQSSICLIWGRRCETGRPNLIRADKKLVRSLQHFVFILSIYLALMIFVSSFTSAASPGAFYLIGSGARARALGNTFVGVADDASSVYWNPAGITQLESPEFMLMDRITALDTNYVNFSGVLPINETIGSLGLNAIFYSVGQIPIFDNLGNPGGQLTETEGALVLSYAYGLNDISFGINFKALYQQLDGDQNAAGAGQTQTYGGGVDLAILYHASENFRVGVMLRDKIKLRDTDGEEVYSATIPRSVTSGMLYRIPIGSANHWSLMADIEQRRELPLRFHFGTEFTLSETVSLRAGLNDVIIEKRKADISFNDLFSSSLKPTLGFGISRLLGNTTLSLDYAASFAASSPYEAN